jgi:predicted metal-dependent phosphoesterase TrpH
VRLDLHLHSVGSPDSRLTLEKAVDRLGAAGLQGFALTDHNTVAGHQRLAELAARYSMYRFIPGIEVSTAAGHLLVYGISEVPPVRAPLPETVDWVHAHGGVAVLAHPLRWAHGVGRVWMESARIDGIEGINGHNGEVANARAELAAARRQVAVTGGSDAHDAGGVGRAFTEFPEAASTVDELLEALRRGETVAGGRSLGPAERVRLAVGTGLRRARRGFRSI